MRRFFEKLKRRPEIFLYILMFAIGLAAGIMRVGRTANRPAGGDGTLAAYFLDVGQADCTLLVSDGKTMMIDCGNRDDYLYIDDYLRGLGIDRLDILILTHPHEDHIGSAAQIISDYDIGKIYMPNMTADSNVFADLLTAAELGNYTVALPEYGVPFEFGGSEACIFGMSGLTDDPNDASLITRVCMGRTAFIFMGDAERDAERELLDRPEFLESSVIKVGHHGAATSTSEELLDRIQPQYAVISCGAANSYGHPHEQTLQRLIERGIEIFRTDVQGDFWAVSDGKSVKFSCEGYKNQNYTGSGLAAA